MLPPPLLYDTLWQHARCAIARTVMDRMTTAANPTTSSHKCGMYCVTCKADGKTPFYTTHTQAMRCYGEPNLWPQCPPEPCGCEENVVGFCDFDFGSTGKCEACSGFSARSDCGRAGLPAAGAKDCSSRCFGETEGAMQYAGATSCVALHSTKICVTLR